MIKRTNMIRASYTLGAAIGVAALAWFTWRGTASSDESDSDMDRRHDPPTARSGYSLAGVVVDRDGAPLDAYVSAPELHNVAGTRTDAGGRFALQGVPVGYHKLRVFKTGYCVWTSEHADGDETIQVVLRRPTTVGGTVRRADGSPAQGATVSGNSTSGTKTDSNGEFTLHGVKPGRTTLRVTLDDDDGRSPVDEREVHIKADGTTRVQITLERATESFLNALLIDADGKPLAGWTMDCVSHLSNTAVSDSNGRVGLTLTGRPGELAKLVLRPNGVRTRFLSYRIRLRCSADPAVAAKPVTVPDETWITVVARSQDGKRLEQNVVVEAWARFGPSGAKGTALSPGESQLTVHAGSTYEGLSVSAVGFAKYKKEPWVSPNAPETIDVQLVPLGRVVGKLVDSLGEPVRRGWIAAANASLGHWTDPREFGGDGSFDLPGVPPGTVAFTASRLVGEPGVEYCREIRVRGGRTTNIGTVVLDQIAPLRGLVVDTAGRPIPRAAVRFREAHGLAHDDATTERDGSFTIQAAKGLKGELEVGARGYGRMAREVDTEDWGNQQTVVLKEGGRIDVRIRVAALTPPQECSVNLVGLDGTAQPHRVQSWPFQVSREHRFSVDDLAGGRYRVSLRVLEEHGVRTLVRPVTLVPGEAEAVSFELN